ncbi:hypothetical protein K501DRAFT_265824 [Backusella circina FSU 941]|nr:hypothetical protein K501DRAFT_265824 [Backusella circina FSU 941]
MPHSNTTQEQIETMICYAVNNKISVSATSCKANISSTTGIKYYRKFLDHLNDRSHITGIKHGSIFTQNKIKELIYYIADNKREEATIKRYILRHTGPRYFQKYLNNPNYAIPVLRGKVSRAPYTQDQRKESIRPVVDNKMSMTEASIKGNVSRGTGRKYYQLYLNEVQS